MQRRLAPVNRSGKGLATKYPAGANVELKVSRGEQELLLQWPTPPQPPAENAETVYGLFPPETWRVDRVHQSTVEIEDEEHWHSGVRKRCQNPFLQRCRPAERSV